MAGNELAVCEFLIENIEKIDLPHIGTISSLGAPNPGRGYTFITNIDQLRLISTEDSSKKADIYINDHGVSIKKKGPCFLYNRLYRVDTPDFFRKLNFPNVEEMVRRLDDSVSSFHNGIIKGRNRPWQEFMSEEDFFSMAETLMMKYSAVLGESAHPATFILEAPSDNISAGNVSVFTFNEFFEEYKEKMVIAIRRQWVGQTSQTEHKRALHIASNPGNAPWVFNNVSGKPSGWRDEFPPERRKTTYFVMIEKLA